MYKRFRFGLILILAMVAAAAHAADVGFPLIQSLASFPFDEEGLTLRRGAFASTLTIANGNVFMFNAGETSVNDLESLDVVLSLRAGLTDYLTLEFYSRWSGIGGGWMDGVIENFHDAFGLPDNNRSLSPRDDIQYRYAGCFSLDAPRAVTGPFTLGLSARLVHQPGFRLGGRLAVQASPAGAAGLLSDRPALITGLWARWGRGERFAGVSVHMAFYKAPTWLQGVSITPRTVLAEAWGRLGWLRTGIIWRSSPFREGDEARDGWQIFLGFRLFRGVELRLQEDLAPFDTTPDISLGLRIRLHELAKGR